MTNDRFRERLLAERARASSALEFLRGEHATTISDELGEPGLDQHPADAATETVDREIDLTLEDNEVHLLVEIDAALARLDAGTFGVCSHCGGPVGDERLEALPHARLCIECKRREERG